LVGSGGRGRSFGGGGGDASDEVRAGRLNALLVRLCAGSLLLLPDILSALFLSLMSSASSSSS
jgi:hypothetical protein